MNHGSLGALVSNKPWWHIWDITVFVEIKNHDTISFPPNFSISQYLSISGSFMMFPFFVFWWFAVSDFDDGCVVQKGHPPLRHSMKFPVQPKGAPLGGSPIPSVGLVGYPFFANPANLPETSISLTEKKSDFDQHHFGDDCPPPNHNLWGSGC